MEQSLLDLWKISKNIDQNRIAKQLQVMLLEHDKLSEDQRGNIITLPVIVPPPDRLYIVLHEYGEDVLRYTIMFEPPESVAFRLYSLRSFSRDLGNVCEGKREPVTGDVVTVMEYTALNQVVLVRESLDDYRAWVHLGQLVPLELIPHPDRP